MKVSTIAKGSKARKLAKKQEGEKVWSENGRKQHGKHTLHKCRNREKEYTKEGIGRREPGRQELEKKI